MTDLGGAVRRPFLSWPGRIETPGTVKRRLLLVASIMAIAVAGVYEVASLDTKVVPCGDSERFYWLSVAWRYLRMMLA